MAENLIKTPAQLREERLHPPAAANGKMVRTMNKVGEEVYNAIAREHAKAFQELERTIQGDLVEITKALGRYIDAEIEKRSLRGRIRQAWAVAKERAALVLEEIWHREYFTAEGDARRAGVTYGELLDAGVPHPDLLPSDELCDGTSNCSRADEHDDVDGAPEAMGAPELVKP